MLIRVRPHEDKTKALRATDPSAPRFRRYEDALGARSRRTARSVRGYPFWREGWHLLQGWGYDAPDRVELHSPYPDYAKLAKDDPDLVKQFRLPGCNECHGGTGGGGICPAVTQGVWFWGNTDDVLFRLVTLGSVDLEKEGYTRLTYGTVHAPMPPMGAAIKTSDQLWKIIAFIRSINPPGSNPPEKILPKE